VYFELLANNLFLPEGILNLTLPLRIMGKQLNRFGGSSSLKGYLRDLGKKSTRSTCEFTVASNIGLTGSELLDKLQQNKL